MELRSYMKAQGLSLEALADRLGMPVTTTGKYVRGERIPRPDQMKTIFERTGRQVTANDFYGLELAGALAGEAIAAE